MVNAPIYIEKGIPTCVDLRERVRAILSQLPPSKLLDDLNSTLQQLDEACMASCPIQKDIHTVGYGVSAPNKAIACDTAIAIIKQIKATKAW